MLRQTFGKYDILCTKWRNKTAILPEFDWVSSKKKSSSSASSVRFSAGGDRFTRFLGILYCTNFVTKLTTLTHIFLNYIFYNKGWFTRSCVPLRDVYHLRCASARRAASSAGRCQRTPLPNKLQDYFSTNERWFTKVKYIAGFWYVFVWLNYPWLWNTSIIETINFIYFRPVNGLSGCEQHCRP